MKIKGTFEVKTASLEFSHNPNDELNISRSALSKVFKGELKGKSQGEMLSITSPDNKAGYVAVEQVIGEIFGKKGSFALQHFGTMTPVSQHLNLVITPGSGRGEFEGISGAMQIEIVDGVHKYELDYLL